MIQKIDAAKLFLLKEAPGSYVDMDIEFVKSAYNLYNEYDLIFSTGNMWATISFFMTTFKEININNGFFFVRFSDTPFLDHLSKKMEKIMMHAPNHILPSLQVFSTTGPEVFTWAVKAHLKQNPPLQINIDKPVSFYTPKFNERVGIFNQRVFECRTQAESTPYTVAFHRYEATWSPLINSFYCNYTDSTPEQRALWITAAVFAILSLILLSMLIFLFILHAIRFRKMRNSLS